MFKIIKKMTTATVQQISKEDIKEAIMTLIRENNAEFRQLLSDLLPKTLEKTKKKVKQDTPFRVVKKERVPYREMPFWKANPDLKAHDASEYALSKEFFDALMAFATNPETQLTDDMIKDMD